MSNGKELVQETIRVGATGWVMGNGETELFLTKAGGMHAPVTFFMGSEQPIQPYFLNDWQEKHPGETPLPLLENLRGDFFCLPFGGNGEPVSGISVPCHGETANLDWNFENAMVQGDTSTFQFGLDLKSTTGHVQKQLQMKKGHSALYITHTVTGLDAKMPYGNHVILQMPEEEEKMYLSMSPIDFGMTPPGLFSDPKNGEYQFVAQGEAFGSLESVPTSFKSPCTWDYSTYPSPIGYTDLFSLFHRPRHVPVWTTAVYPSRGYLYFSLKKPEELPGTTLWVANSGRYGSPWNGKTRCIGIEETCSNFDKGWKASMEENALTRHGWKTYGDFHADTPYKVRMIQGVVRIPLQFTKVRQADFTPDGVTFTDLDGQSVSATVDWSFLK